MWLLSKFTSLYGVIFWNGGSYPKNTRLVPTFFQRFLRPSREKYFETTFQVKCLPNEDLEIGTSIWEHLSEVLFNGSWPKSSNFSKAVSYTCKQKIVSRSFFVLVILGRFSTSSYWETKRRMSYRCIPWWLWMVHPKWIRSPTMNGIAYVCSYWNDRKRTGAFSITAFNNLPQQML